MRTLLIPILLLSLGCGGRTLDPVEALPVAPPVPPRAAVDRDDQLLTAAEAEVRKAARSEDPSIRANAAEAAGPRLPDVVDFLLRDPDARVRFAAAMTVGRHQLDLPGVRGTLADMADGPSPNARVAAVYALHRLGDRSRSQRLVDYARSPDPLVRANTALALGLTGEPSALPALTVLGDDADPDVRLAAAEAVWRLGRERGLANLLAATLNQYSSDNVLGTLGLAAHDDANSRAALAGKLTADYPEVRLAAARGLGQLGSDAGYGVALQAADDPEPRRRTMAAAALGEIGRGDAQPVLAELARDPEPAVRVAAAAAVLKLRDFAGRSDPADPADAAPASATVGAP